MKHLMVAFALFAACAAEATEYFVDEAVVDPGAVGTLCFAAQGNDLQRSDGRIGMLVVRYSDDDGEYYPKRVTLRLASGASLADATFHMTDRDLVHTAFDPEPNADGSVDVMMYPCSFVLVETKPLPLASRP